MERYGIGGEAEGVERRKDIDLGGHVGQIQPMVLQAA